MGGKPFLHSHSNNCSRVSSGLAPVPCGILVNEVSNGTPSSEQETGLEDLLRALQQELSCDSMVLFS